MNPPATTDRISAGQTRHRCRRCLVCDRATREGKPYCTAHVRESDYTQGVLARIAKREAEAADAERGEIDPRGHLVEDALLVFFDLGGVCTARNLRRYVHLSERGTQALVKALLDAGHVTAHRQKRGVVMLRLRGRG